MALIIAQNKLLQDQLSALNQESNVTIPIPPTNKDMADDNEPLPTHGRGGACHYQVPNVDETSFLCNQYDCQESKLLVSASIDILMSGEV
jgi:hypothetical protein